MQKMFFNVLQLTSSFKKNIFFFFQFYDYKFMRCKDFGEEHVHVFSNKRLSGSQISKNVGMKSWKNLKFILYFCE